MDNDPALEDHDRGLSFDLGALVGRRRLLGLVAGGVGAAVLAACSSGSSSGDAATATTSGSAATTGTTGTTGTTAATSGTLSETPEETAGPFPGDGSNGANVLADSGVVRQDIRSSFGSSTTTAEGVPLTITLKVVDGTGAAQAGHAVYVWHCDRDGNYSLYSLPDENYLRGVQETAADGTVSFTSVFPACYSGRWPHIHYEVYPSLDDATDAANKVATSQIALPEDVCNTVYATSGYERSVSNMKRVSLTTDMVFQDSWRQELGTVTGGTDDGYTCTLTCVL
jgi:protocatechuate 3,4-dioxygenase beta subunit